MPEWWELSPVLVVRPRRGEKIQEEDRPRLLAEKNQEEDRPQFRLGARWGHPWPRW